VVVYKRQIARYLFWIVQVGRQNLPAYEHFLHPLPLEKYKSHVNNLLHMNSHYQVEKKLSDLDVDTL